MVSLLLQHCADANAINNDGRSALMEAALWGRIESVKALLNANANKRLRDHESRCAMVPVHTNGKERYRRSTYAAAESVAERNRDRQYIILLLDYLNTKKQHGYTVPLSESEHKKYSFRKSQSEMIIMLYGSIRSYCVPHITKTAAILDRGDQFACIWASSVGVPMAYL